MRTVVSVQTSLVCSSIVRWGTEEQKQHWLPKLCSGEWLGCFGLTEPDTGSDAANQKTRAAKIDSGWAINGDKMWISLGNHAKVAMIFAQTDPEKKHRGLACFLVPTERGLLLQEIHGKMGLHGSDTAELSLDDVEVPDDALMGEIGDGFKVAMSALDSGRYSRGRRLRRHLPGVARRLGGVREGARAVRHADRVVPARAGDDRRHARADRRRAPARLPRRLAEGHRPAVTTETSIAKLYATEAAQNCAHLAIQVHGGSGYVDDHPVERYYRDVRVTTLYEGTSQIQKLIIGRAETGHQRAPARGGRARAGHCMNASRARPRNHDAPGGFARLMPPRSLAAAVVAAAALAAVPVARAATHVPDFTVTLPGDASAASVKADPNTWIVGAVPGPRTAALAKRFGARGAGPRRPAATWSHAGARGRSPLRCGRAAARLRAGQRLMQRGGGAGRPALRAANDWRPSWPTPR